MYQNKSIFTFSVFLFVVLNLSSASICSAQDKSDSLKLTLSQCDKIFMDSSYLLLAAHYNIDVQKALVEQAKYWQNPVLNTDQVIAANGKMFPYGVNEDGTYSGQYFIQVQQLILTAKKRGKLIDIASSNAVISSWQLADLIRNLRYQLHQDFYTIQQQLELLSLYNEQLQQLFILQNGLEAGYKLGNIAQKDLVRVQALVIALQQDITDLKKSIADTQNDIKTILQIKKESVFITPLNPTYNKTSSKLSLDSIVTLALTTNPYYKLQEETTRFYQKSLAYQQALKVPDVTLGPNFDRNSNFQPNYVGLGISLPIPVLNKNKGNIKAAAANVNQQKAIVESAATDLQNSVIAAYQKLLLTEKQQTTSLADFYSTYQKIFSNMLESYRLKQISLLEFLDFYNDYTDTKTRYFQQKLNLALSKEELQFLIGKDILN